MLDQNIVLKANELFTAGSIETDGSRESASGLYIRDTRHLTRFDLTLNGSRLERLTLVQTDLTTATIVATNQMLHLAGERVIRPQSLLITEQLSISGQLTADITIENVSTEAMTVPVQVTAGADFRDLFDIRGFARSKRGVVLTPELSDKHARLAYRGVDNRISATTISYSQAPVLTTAMQPSALDNAGLSHAAPSRRSREMEQLLAWPTVTGTWTVSLAPLENWSVRIIVRPEPADGRPVSPDALNWPTTAVPISDPLLAAVHELSLRDLAALDTTFANGPLAAAGIPWFVSPFGRDSLIAALQTLHLTPERAKATLRTLASLQGTTIDPYKEEEPGKICHEMRYGEMARTHEVPHTPYFGSIDATPLWLWLLAETVGQTGDKSLFDELFEPMMRALDWCTQFGDLDGDSLIEYRSDHRGPGTIANQVWKDSYDSLTWPDRSTPIGPIAAVEVQGYSYAAHAQLAELATRYGHVDLGERLRQRAKVIQAAVEATFWLPDQHCYAQALDGNKRPIPVVTSNAGQLLATGLPSAERAGILIDRLMEPDMMTHWGMRTLSAAGSMYNPISYHNGSIWPHDNSIVGVGCYRYGRADAGDRILQAMVTAAATMPDYRLPELYCGFDADGLAMRAPIPYPVSCSPQAWAAGAVPYLLNGRGRQVG